MDGNNVRKAPMRARAIVMKCSDDIYMDVQRILRGLPDCYVVYSKSSNQKLVIKEEGW